MKPMWKDILTALGMGLVLPWLLLNFAVLLLSARQEPVAQQDTTGEMVQTEDFTPVSLPMRLRHSDGTTEEMDLDTYLVGAVLAEMPASFEMEALKAQAVVARTYTQKAYTTGGKHGDGSVCTQPGCCQAYLAEEAYLERGGALESVEKIRTAVLATSGYVLTYEGELIEATYFSCSGGATEDAAAVWGTDYPYLRSVESPGEEGAAYFTDSVSFTSQEFQNALGVTLTGTPDSWLGAVTRTAGGGVDTMVIGGKVYQGTTLRTCLGLRSTAFEVSASGDTITVATKGYGHRVGMSQYGADAMAVAGSSYQQILAYYYQGTELTWLGN